MATTDQIQSNSLTAVDGYEDRLNQLVTSATEAADALKNFEMEFADPLPPPGFDFSGFQALGEAITAISGIPEPTLEDGVAKPSALDGFTAPTSPEFEAATAPIKNFGAEPGEITFELPTEPAQADINFLSLSSLQNVTLPSEPSEQSFGFPALSSVTIPTFDLGEVPEYDGLDSGYLTARTVEWTEQDYQSELLDALNLELMNNLVNGGYGINVDDEAQLFERAMLRQEEARQMAIDTATAEAATRGFELPPGALMELVDKAIKDSADRLTELNRDIYLKRSDMYVENRKFTIEQSRELEAMMITYWGYRQERAMKMAQTTVEMAISVYNALANVYNLKVAAYKTSVDAYNERVKAALAPLEVDSAIIERSKGQVAAYSAVIQAYAARVQAAMSTVEINKSLVEQDRLKFEIEKVKLDQYRTKVEAFKALVDARQSEAQIKVAQWDGYKAKVAAYGEEVRAYSVETEARLSAFKAKIEANKDVYQVRQLEVQTKGLEMQAYGTEVQAVGTFNQSKIAAYRAKIEAYGEQIKGYSASVAAQAELFKSISNYNIAINGSENRTMLQAFDGIVRANQVLTGTYTNSAQLYANAVSGFASAASGISAKIETA